MSRRAAGGSRYPSAYGHTPSYRSYSSSVPSSVPTGYGTAGAGAAGLGSSLAMGDSMLSSSRAFDDLASMGTSTGLYSKPSYGSGSAAQSTVQSSSTSYSSYSNSADGRGGVPKVEYSADKSYHSTTQDGSGIPRTSHAVSSSGYSSDNPYKNRNFNYSYNI